jgi:hypothetical protein
VENNFKGEAAMINRILGSLIMFFAMISPSVLLLLLQFSSTLVRADRLTDWYMQQLFEPTNAQLQQETAGRVKIYSGLRDIEVARALDEQFDRIEYMMFTGTIMTDVSGAVITDAETGEVLVENDGC